MLPIDTFTLRKKCSFKPSKESTESKSVTLEIEYMDATIRSLAESTMSTIVIRYQNGRARKDYHKITDGSVIKVKWLKPAAAPSEDPRSAMLRSAVAAGVDVKDHKALAEYITQQLAAFNE